MPPNAHHADGSDKARLLTQGGTKVGDGAEGYKLHPTIWMWGFV